MLLKPSNKFDPSPEEVLRFCGQLARVHSATTRVTEPASTRTIRVTLTGAGEGRMAQLLSGPAAAEQILRHRGFAQVELADPAAMLSSGASGPGSGHVHIGVGDYDHTVENHNNLLGLFRENEDTLYRLAQNPDRPRPPGAPDGANPTASPRLATETSPTSGAATTRTASDSTSSPSRANAPTTSSSACGTAPWTRVSFRRRSRQAAGLTEAAFRTPGENHPRR